MWVTATRAATEPDEGVPASKEATLLQSGSKMTQSRGREQTLFHIYKLYII